MTAVAVKDSARATAVDVVLAVERDGAFANLLLPRLLRDRGLSGQDAAFATELGYGALRWQGVLDDVVSAASNRDVAALDPPVRAVLRVGAYQLLHTRVPAHAAVSTTVDLGKSLAGHRSSGLVNAVMRRVAERDWPGWVAALAPADETGRLAFEHGYPRWIAEAFLAALAYDVGELKRALAADRPVTHLAAVPGRIDRDRLAEVAGAGAAPGPFSPYAVRLSGGDPGRVGPVQDGRARVQDEGSQLVALALARGQVEGRDARWLDMCAGPGGKAALLAGLMPADARLLAGDLHRHRAALVRAGASPTTTVVAADATRPAWRAAAFDRVLLDAPCSGLGALRRRPESRWRRRADDIEHLTALQRRLLACAVESVRVGGLVVYATCSPHLAETREVVHAVTRQAAVERIDARECLPGVPELGTGPEVQLWPHRHGTDAMFIALLRRTG